MRSSGGALDLVIVSAPEEVEQRMDDLVCSPEQTAIIEKIHHALHHRDFLNRHRIYEVGKLLFVGPPGTGKTSLALAMSHSMHMPVLEVRLSMITSQYPGGNFQKHRQDLRACKETLPLDPLYRRVRFCRKEPGHR